ncbi:MAG: D-tyrosyl-tRNA(Tyr) deacylase [Eubacteriaceae bacterium]|nr:D-tyrosyl-tRNA(Tyr) deacylase [Eubacteriaceae bacterium]
MKAVIQRVSFSSVKCGEYYAQIDGGLNILLGIEKGDTLKEAQYIAQKAGGMRIFDDSEGKMNLAGDPAVHKILLISQFTLCADTRRGRRPSFINAMDFDQAQGLYEQTARLFEEMGFEVVCGVYGGDMEVTIVNDGPVTVVLDSREMKGGKGEAENGK